MYTINLFYAYSNNTHYYLGLGTEIGGVGGGGWFGRLEVHGNEN